MNLGDNTDGFLRFAGLSHMHTVTVSADVEQTP
jgi:hypothetical protein